MSGHLDLRLVRKQKASAACVLNWPFLQQVDVLAYLGCGVAWAVIASPSGSGVRICCF